MHAPPICKGVLIPFLRCLPRPAYLLSSVPRSQQGHGMKTAVSVRVLAEPKGPHWLTRLTRQPAGCSFRQQLRWLTTFRQQRLLTCAATMHPSCIPKFMQVVFHLQAAIVNRLLLCKTPPRCNGQHPRAPTSGLPPNGAPPPLHSPAPCHAPWPSSTLRERAPFGSEYNTALPTLLSPFAV